MKGRTSKKLETRRFRSSLINNRDLPNEKEEMEALERKQNNTIEFNPSKREMPDYLQEFFGGRDDDEDGGMRFVDNFTML